MRLWEPAKRMRWEENKCRGCLQSTWVPGPNCQFLVTWCDSLCTDQITVLNHKRSAPGPAVQEQSCPASAPEVSQVMHQHQLGGSRAIRWYIPQETSSAVQTCRWHIGELQKLKRRTSSVYNNNGLW